jgi:cell division protease FtsH
MSQPPPEKSSKPPGTAGEPGRFNSKLFLIWLGVIALIAFLVSVGGGDAKSNSVLTATQVVQFATEKKIQSISIRQKPEGGHNYYDIKGKLNVLELPVKAEAEAGTAVRKSTKPKEQLFEAKGVLTETNFNTLRENIDAANFKEEPATTRINLFIDALVPILLVGGVIIFFAFQFMKNANRTATSFGKSRAKQLTHEKERVTFQDVAGCDEAKEDVQEVVEFLRNPKKFQRIGGRIPKGILLVGAPGTGKTLLARAVAGEAQVPFFSISGSDFVEMFVGVGAARVRDMFEQARKNAPCIVFIDEIDAVGRQRGAGLGGGHDEREQTLNSLLVEMDGFSAHTGVIIIAATNREDVLDNALLRPGRFDRRIHVDLPDIHGREEILGVHAKKIKLAPDVSLAHIARSTTGFSGADLANLLNEAALLAARRDRKDVSTIEIEESRDKIAFGSERRRLMDAEDRRRTAYHEAGHAVVQSLIDDGQMPLHKVTIIPRGRALGMAMFLPKKDILGQSRKQLLNGICTAMAGRIGEEIATGDFSNGAASDIKQATTIARHMVCDWGMGPLGHVALGENQDHIFLGREITRSQNYSDETARRIDAAIHTLIDEQYKRAQTIIQEHIAAHKTIAEALLQYETLDAIHVQEILQHGAIRTPVEYRPSIPRAAESENVPSLLDPLPPLIAPPPTGIPA